MHSKIVIFLFVTYFIIAVVQASETVQKFKLIVSRNILPGSIKSQITVNGQTPGPIINVTFGNWVEVEVVNEITTEATTLHWHGITQRGIKVKDTISGEGQLAMDYSKYQFVEIGDFAMNHMDLLTGYVDLSSFYFNRYKVH